MERGTVNTTGGAGTLWDPTLEADVPVTDVPDAGERVANGQIPSFHVRFNDVEVDGIRIPPLGAFFFDDELALDYRMGADWTPVVLAAFARLLGVMRAFAPGASLQARPDGAVREHADPRFGPALERYLAASADTKSTHG